MIDRDINICVYALHGNKKVKLFMLFFRMCISFLLLSSILCYTCTFNKIKLKLEMNFGNFNALIFLRSCTKSLIT